MAGHEDAYPFAFQPHGARNVNPETGQEYKITVVPVAQVMSWIDGSDNTADIIRINYDKQY